MQIWKPRDKKLRHNDVISKNNKRQWESADLVRTKQNIYRSKGFEGCYSKMSFFLIWATVLDVMGIYVKFTKTTHQKYGHVMSRDPGFKFRKFFFFA